MCFPLLQVIFSDPYYAAQYNRHTSPQARVAAPAGPAVCVL